MDHTNPRIRLPVLQLDVPKLERGGTLEGAGKTGQKCCFSALFGKLKHIGRPWINVFVRVLQKLAKIRSIIHKT